MDALKHIIAGCQKEKPEAQKELYQLYKDILFAICKRYLRINEDAEDMFVQGFYKILSKIKSYNGSGSFEGWMKRIMINECLMFLRKNKNFNLSIEGNELDFGYDNQIESNLNFKELLQCLEQLPIGYRTVLNMHVIEGYKHREIAKILGISINTSKSQLIAAKRKFQLVLKKKQSRTG